MKRDLHLAGNIRGYHLVRGPKKLMISGVPTLPQALAEFASIEFHEKTLAPFYDHYLKGASTEYPSRPPVEYHLAGANIMRADTEWPPVGVREHPLYLVTGPSGSVTSLNDGSLAAASGGGAPSTSYSYPDPQWAIGHVALTRRGPDPVRRVVTYTSAPLAADLTVAGAPVLVLHVSTTRTDANVIAKLSVQQPQSDEDRRAEINPTATVLAKGWLRASQRALDPSQSLRGEPYVAHTERAYLAPGKVYELTIEMTHMAYRFTAGTRIRLELCCSDSTVTDLQFNHIFTPDMVGTDTFHHDASHPSRLMLPVLEGWRF